VGGRILPSKTARGGPHLFVKGDVAKRWNRMLYQLTYEGVGTFNIVQKTKKKARDGLAFNRYTKQSPKS